jgi:hypothetical protein
MRPPPLKKLPRRSQLLRLLLKTHLLKTLRPKKLRLTKPTKANRANAL